MAGSIKSTGKSPTTSPRTKRRNPWKPPEHLLSKLPTSTWSCIETWKLPIEPPKSEEDHTAIITALAKTPADGAFAPGALAREAPLSFTDEVVACIALGFFFTSPAFGPFVLVAAAYSWHLSYRYARLPCALLRSATLLPRWHLADCLLCQLPQVAGYGLRHDCGRIGHVGTTPMDGRQA